MLSDVPRLRYLLPRFRGDYTALMKTLASSLDFDSSDIAKYRLKVVEFGQKYGSRAVLDAFGVKRSTYFLWQSKLATAQGRLVSLVPISTRPKRVRNMQVDPRIITFVKKVREQYGRVGKEKLKVLLDEYCQELKVKPLSASLIGKVIARHHFFFEGRRKYTRRRNLGVLRVRKSPKETLPGYFELDSVIVRLNGSIHVFVTAIDVVTKQAFCLPTRTTSSKSAKKLLQIIAESACPLRAVQTDNGSEFMGEFDQYCQTLELPHFFTYPRSPKINGGIERFNRTIQEEFIDRSDSFYEGKEAVREHLQAYLSWYNDTRPHQALGYLTPSAYLQTLQSNM